MYFDLSLGVDGIDETSRRELVCQALQLGYTSVSSDHVHSGPLADSDRSTVKPLDVASVLSAASGIADSVKFHRRLLGVPAGQPFRQFSRITVVVDDSVQVSALSSGNAVLRSYDVVAVRPTNQRAFEQACKHSEVDLISLDMFKRVPFRMKAPIVKAALQRGLFFEISYGRSLFDVRARKELFANAQVLQTATRGHGIVISSGASHSMELRGPNDVANMATLFGLSAEVAKVAVSKNCESVILHGVARKKAFKAALIVERVPAVSNDFLFAVPNVWDPLSVGTAKGSSVELTPLLEAVAKRDSTTRSLSRIEDEFKKNSNFILKSSVGNGKNSTVSSKPGDEEETFIPLVNLKSEWTEVGKHGKIPKDRRPKISQDSKKRKFS